MSALRVVLAAATLTLTVAASTNLTRELRAVAATYYANAGRVAALAGRDTTMDYYDRLRYDAADLEYPPANRPEVWFAAMRSVSQLDLSLATQLLHGDFQPMGSIRGIGETLVRSSKDGTMQPVAVYVPTAYDPSHPAPLMVFLHGMDESETQLLGPPYVYDIAQATGTIVVAPYGRGAYDFRGTESDVYDAFDAATHAFSIDDRRRYLAGYSMGGFSVFRLAPLHPHDWTAIMSIAGSLLASRARLLVSSMSNARFYILTGARDATVKTAWPTATAIYLRDAGLPVSFYSQPEGTHSIYTLRTILLQAWEDMVAGTVRSPEGLTGPGDLPDEPH